MAKIVLVAGYKELLTAWTISKNWKNSNNCLKLIIMCYTWLLKGEDITMRMIWERVSKI